MLCSVQDVIKTYNQKSYCDVKRISKLLNNKLNPYYAYLVGKIMGDGHLSKKYVLHFIDQDKKNLIYLRELLQDKFQILSSAFSISYRKAKGTSYKLQVNDCTFGRLLFCLGAPCGNKVRQPFNIPNFIFSNSQNLKMFLRGILEDELSTIKIINAKHCFKAKFKMSKSNDYLEEHLLFMEKIKLGIESFGIQCSLVRICPSKLELKTKEVSFDILSNKKNIIQFEKEIGFFLNSRKKKLLTEAVAVLKNSLPIKIDHNKVFILYQSGLSLRKIAQKLSCSKSHIHSILNNERK